MSRYKKKGLIMFEFLFISAIVIITLNFLEKAIKEKTKKPCPHNNQNKYINKIKKGQDFEKFIGRKFEENGYTVKYNGIEKGKKDSGIDLIAIKGNQLILTQCKNWKEGSRYKINHEKIKAFIGDTISFLEKNPSYKDYNIKRLFCVANDVFDKSAKMYLQSNKQLIEYRIVKPDQD